MRSVLETQNPQNHRVVEQMHLQMVHVSFPGSRVGARKCSIWRSYPSLESIKTMLLVIPLSSSSFSSTVHSCLMQQSCPGPKSPEARKHHVRLTLPMNYLKDCQTMNVHLLIAFSTKAGTWGVIKWKVDRI